MENLHTVPTPSSSLGRRSRRSSASSRDGGLEAGAAEDGGPLVFSDVTSLQKVFGSLLNKPVFNDVIFKVEGHKVYAHRAIIAAWSRPFMAMFTTGMKESSCVEIDLKDVEAKTFMSLLTFMYTGTVALSEDNAMGILALSNKYWIGPLKKRCEKFLTLHINENNACDLLIAADAHDCKRLYASARSFITQHFEHVSTSPAFAQIEAPLLCDILCQDELPTSSE